MATIKVSPGDGRKVRDPVTMQVIGAGYEVDDANPYWFKRIQNGDVTVDADLDAPAPDQPAEPKTEDALTKAQEAVQPVKPKVRGAAPGADDDHSDK